MSREQRYCTRCGGPMVKRIYRLRKAIVDGAETAGPPTLLEVVGVKACFRRSWWGACRE